MPRKMRKMRKMKRNNDYMRVRLSRLCCLSQRLLSWVIADEYVNQCQSTYTLVLRRRHSESLNHAWFKCGSKMEQKPDIT